MYVIGTIIFFDNEKNEDFYLINPIKTKVNYEIYN